MSRKKFKKGSGPRFTQLEEWFQSSEAWATMKPGPRALYIELKRRFNGSNNGSIFLSHRDAAKALNVGRDTVGGYFQELEWRGFIVVTMGHCLGPSGVGQANKYALTELPLNQTPATKDFMQWEPEKKQKPCRKTRHSLAGKSDTGGRKTRHSQHQMSENPTALGQNEAKPMSENPAIYTSNHVVSISEANGERPSKRQAAGSPDETPETYQSKITGGARKETIEAANRLG